MTAENKITETGQKGKKKAQLSHALIDVDFCDKPKIKSLTYKYGQMGPWFLTRLILAMSRATDARIDMDAALCIGKEIGLEFKAKEIIEYLIANDLIQRIEGVLTQDRIEKDQQKIQKQRDDWNNRQTKSRDKSRDTHSDNSVTSLVTLNTEQLNTEDLNLDPKKIAKPGMRALGYGIEVTEIDYEALKVTFFRLGLEEKWIERAAVRLAAWYDKNPTKRSRNGPYLDLASWGAERCVEEKEKLERKKNTEKIGKKFEPPADNRPKSKSVREVMAAQGIPVEDA